MKNFVAEGKRVDVIAPADVASGQALLVGTGLFGVVAGARSSGETAVLVTEGIFTIKAKAADVVAVGDKLYWDDTNKELTITSTANTYVGVAISAKGAVAGDVEIKLTPGAA